MRAEEKVLRATVRVEMSELDQKDGLKLKARSSVYTFSTKVDSKDSTDYAWDISQITGLSGWGQLSSTVDFSNGKVIQSASDVDAISYTVIDTKNENILATVTDAEDAGLFTEKFIHNGDDVTVIVNFTVDRRSADSTSDAAYPADDVDDRLQTTYGVYLEKSPNTGLYYLAANYTVNSDDDVAKLVNNGDYVGLPEFDVPASSDSEYVYEYSFKDGAIYGTYVKGEYSSFGKLIIPDHRTQL